MGEIGYPRQWKVEWQSDWRRVIKLFEFIQFYIYNVKLELPENRAAEL